MAEVRTIREIAEAIGGSVEGDGSVGVRGVATLEQAGPEDLTFVFSPKYARRLVSSRALAALVGTAVKADGKTLIRVENVPRALAEVLAMWDPGDDLPPAGIDPTAVVAPDAAIGEGVAIGPGVIIGAGSSIGDASVLCAGVRVGSAVTIGSSCLLREGVVVRTRTILGDRVRIGPNSVIGNEGFGFYQAGGLHHRVPHIGNVVIENDVEIGSCTCVDRGKFMDTRIGEGTKIDNLVQIAHNVQIGRRCIIASQAGIAGSARIGDDVIVMGQAGVRDNISVGAGVQIGALAGVMADVEAGQAVTGMPARIVRQQLRIYQAEIRLPDLIQRVKELEARLKSLELPEDHR